MKGESEKLTRSVAFIGIQTRIVIKDHPTERLTCLGGGGAVGRDLNGYLAGAPLPAV
jgi:hypothetical protein